MTTPPARSFTAKDYSDEFAQLNRAVPHQAQAITNFLLSEYRKNYEKEILARPGKGFKNWALHHDSLIAHSLFTGFMFGGLTAIVGVGVTALTAGAMAPIALPLAAGGALLCGSSLKLANTRADPDSLATQEIMRGIESGELIKFCIETSKRFDRTLPSCMDVFDDKHMARHYTTVIEVGALSQLPFLTPAFENGANKKMLPAPATDDQIKPDPKTPKL